MKLMSHELASLRQPSTEVVSHRVNCADKLWRITLVREAMEAGGMRQKDLAEWLGLHKAHVNRWLHGVRPVPDHYLPRLAELLEVAA
jgi:CRP-like cAMP-binding protein